MADRNTVAPPLRKWSNHANVSSLIGMLRQPRHPDTLSDFWRNLCTAAKVSKIRLHDARHSCASLMHADGAPIAVISAWMGHADPAFTLRTYVHTQNDALKAAAASLQRVDAPS